MPYITFKSDAEAKATPPPSPRPAPPLAPRLDRLCEREGMERAEFRQVYSQDCYVHYSGAVIPMVEILRDLATRSGTVKNHIEGIEKTLSPEELTGRKAAFEASNTLREGHFVRSIEDHKAWEQMVEETGRESMRLWEMYWDLQKQENQT